MFGYPGDVDSEWNPEWTPQNVAEWEDQYHAELGMADIPMSMGKSSAFGVGSDTTAGRKIQRKSSSGMGRNAKLLSL